VRLPHDKNNQYSLFFNSLFFKVAIKQADKLGRLRGTQKTATGAKKKFSTSDVVRGESVFLSVLNFVGALRLTLVSLGVLFLLFLQH
jgi:hypothetical protein